MPFLSEAIQQAPPQEIHLSQEESVLVDQKIQEALKKEAVKAVQTRR